jgi:hypothetical protein
MTTSPLPSNFAVLILTHRRANRVKTYKTLRSQGYSGPIFLVCDTSDPELESYKATYGSAVQVFDKASVSTTFDVCDNRLDFKGVVYARNACWSIARNLKLQTFLALDDDYNHFSYRVYDDDRLSLTRRGGWTVKSLDAIFAAHLRFLNDSNAATVTFAQGGDFIGGRFNQFAVNPTLRRKAMNSFFCDVDRPFDFLGRINEDVNAYVAHGMRGKLFFTVPLISLDQEQTQTNKGGLTEQYLTDGTYQKSFHTVMLAPSCVKIGLMGRNAMRLHHKINWRYTVPVILHERHKKQVSRRAKRVDTTAEEQPK